MLRNAADGGSLRACGLYGWLLQRPLEAITFDMALAVQYLQRSVDGNDPPGILALAVSREGGKLVGLQRANPCDEDDAIFACEAEARQPDADPAVLVLLGMCYSDGYIVDQDVVRGASLFERASSQHFLLACSSLAYCYEFGEGVAVDKDKSRALNLEGANRGYVCVREL